MEAKRAAGEEATFGGNRTSALAQKIMHVEVTSALLSTLEGLTERLLNKERVASQTSTSAAEGAPSLPGTVESPERSQTLQTQNHPDPASSTDGTGASRSVPEVNEPPRDIPIPRLVKYLPRFLLNYRIFRHSWDLRRVIASDLAYNSRFKYTDNHVKTSKYNIITFLPLNLIEQFTRVANTYFLILVLVQLIPEVVAAIPSVSSVSVATTIIPLVFVLGVTAIKDAFDDIRRHVSDFRINHRKTLVLKNGVFQSLPWSRIETGDIVKLENNDFVPADMVILAASEPNSLAYVETAELDGETNLKVRQALPETHDQFVSDAEEGPRLLMDAVTNFDGYVVCDPPNNNLHKFDGTLYWNGLSHYAEGLSLEQLMLRGCRLRNTKWAVGVVVYAGHETKLMKNTGQTLYKRTQLDRRMNVLVIAILIFLGVLLLASVFSSLLWEYLYGQLFQVFVPYDAILDDPAKIAFYQVLSNLIILNTLVPISLYVSVELIRLGQSYLINWDTSMYYEDEDVAPQARTTTLNEELGQIDYIFSDKTGTLTQNVMVFHKCCIGMHAKKFGDTPPELKGSKYRVDLKWNPHQDEDFMFYDRQLVTACVEHQPDVARFFKLVALCHTVLANVDEDGCLQYSAQSPDEAALVSAAKNFGYIFADRTPYSVTLKLVDPKDKHQLLKLDYELLNILEFNNDRKRMSVIVRCPENDPEDPGKLLLLCKGADVKIQERLNSENAAHWKATEEALQDYAKEGLRTLCMAVRELPEDYYREWDLKHQQASTTLQDREEALVEVYEEIEKDFVLLGASAIEDKLQDGVPETIYNLSRANLKIWVLTGDKMETAINIGYSCKLLQEDMEVHCIDGDDSEVIRGELENVTTAHRKSTAMEASTDTGRSSESDASQKSKKFALVVSGGSLKRIFDEKLDLTFLKAAACCSAVVCCRVTPLQKRKVVTLVKENKKAITLAIGDGANDVGMIKAAHIGVGISGREGRQAVLASDFSFGQFRYLERLLLIHGRWSYHRMSIFLRYFFYKNFAFTFSQFIFALFCGFTGQTVYSQGYITVYNVVYTSLPIMALAILDQDIDEENCRKFPKIYTLGQQNKEFNYYLFFLTLVKGILTSGAIFFVLFALLINNVHPGTGFELDYESFQFMTAAALTIVVNVEIALDTLLWTPITHLFIILSIFAYFFLTVFFAIDSFYNALLIGPLFQDAGVPSEVLSSSSFWFYCLLIVVLCIFPVIFKRIVGTMLWPTLVDYIRYDIQHKRRIKTQEAIQAELFPRKRKISMLQESQKRKVTVYTGGEEVVRTGFAFSGAERGAELIMSGRAFKEQTVEESKRRRSLLHSSHWTGVIEEAVVSPGLSRSSSRHSMRSTHSEHQEWSHEREDADAAKEKTPSEGPRDVSSMEESAKSAESNL